MTHHGERVCHRWFPLPSPWPATVRHLQARSTGSATTAVTSDRTAPQTGHTRAGVLRPADSCLAPDLMETINPTGSKIECQRHGSSPTSCGSGRSSWCDDAGAEPGTSRKEACQASGPAVGYQPGNPARLGDRAEIDDGDKLESPPRRRRGIAISELDAFLGRAAHLATRDGEIHRPHRHAPSFAWRP
jgi:hypothetical protein